MKKFIIRWKNGTDLGVYIALTKNEAILAAIRDAGYRDLQDAKDFVMDESGNLILCAEPCL